MKAPSNHRSRQAQPPARTIYRFADFSFDTSTGELYRQDRRVPLRPQAAKVLGLLLLRAGELVRREELRRLLWGDEAIDADAGINHCVRQVRRALADTAAEPRFVATEHRRGYRFVGAVRTGPEANRPSDAAQPPARGPLGQFAAGTSARRVVGRIFGRAPSRRRIGPAALIAGLAGIVALAGIIAAYSRVPNGADGTVAGEAPATVRADYERARYLLEQPDPAAAGRAVPLLERVTAAAPDFAAGHAALARALLQADPTAPVETAREHVQRALLLDPRHAEALLVRGDIRSLVDHDWAAARRDFLRARRADPDLAEALHHHAGLRAILGDDDGAIELMRRALEIDPVSPLLAGDLAWFHFVARDWAAARHWARRTLELEPAWSAARSILLHASVRAGDVVEVRRLAAESLRAAGADQHTVEAIGAATEPMDPYWRWWKARLADSVEPASRLHRAWVDAALGHTEAALDELAALEAAGYRPLVFLLRDPRLDPLRAAPRFTALLDRLGLTAAPSLVVSDGFSLPSLHESR